MPDNNLIFPKNEDFSEHLNSIANCSVYRDYKPDSTETINRIVISGDIHSLLREEGDGWFVYVLPKFLLLRSKLSAIVDRPAAPVVSAGSIG